MIAAIAIMAAAETACDHGPKIGPPAQMAKRNNGQSGAVGTPLPLAPEVVIADGNGYGVPGITVNFIVTSGNGSVQNGTAQTDKKGVASAGTWTLGTLAGVQSLTATAIGVPGSPLNFIATAAPGPATALNKVGSEPASSPAGGNVDSIVVQATDQFGNAVPNQTVAFSVTAGGGSVSPATRVTLADGRAAARWTLGPDVGVTNTAKASRPDGTLPVTFSTAATRPVASVRFTDHVIVVDSAASVAPAVGAYDAAGTQLSGAQITLTARNVAVASAGSTVTGLKSGETFLVATSVDNAAARDSAMIVVGGGGKPIVTLTLPRFDLKADTTFTVSLVLDPRSATTAVGAATLQVSWNTSALTFVGEQAVTVNGALVDVSTANAASGVVTVGLASSAGITSATELRRLTFKASSVVNRTGVVSVDVVDMTAAGTLVNLAALTVSGFYPLRIR